MALAMPAPKSRRETFIPKAIFHHKRKTELHPVNTLHLSCAEALFSNHFRIKAIISSVF